MAYAHEQCPSIFSYLEPDQGIEVYVASFSNGCRGSFSREIEAFNEILVYSKYVSASFHALLVLIGKLQLHFSLLDLDFTNYE